MAELQINGVPIQDDYSETFAAQMVRVLVTSVNRRWAYEAAMETKGLGRSATAPPCEATIECELGPEDTPDGRPGFVIQMMDRKLEKLQQCMALRIRKGAVPNPKTAVFNLMPPELAEDHVDLEGTVIQKFGDGYETEMEYCGRNVYRIPRMDGWLYVERKFGTREAVTGGMFLILGDSDENALAAAEKALDAAGKVPLIVVKNAASGSKVGAKNYTDMVATTNHTYCPTLHPHEDSQIEDNVKCIYEIIVSGPRESDVRAGMKAGIEAATDSPGVLAIHTANYGGKLGKGKIPLHSLFA
ncbi:formylmethanofuran--tetrahydromethanopterin N-formyltransferase [Calycomorphotria hydatis]|uniref:Formyltransferase/hydrolase complex subunit D n=1 Tax=Calycomorphotria hydatis TaxID=2528027 RepID=A0A517T472_9PLAN|nr:formylmethanofuran--tetrahydromethanopterin N-formyltransferase [Calycomorphotria hydatis]QDT63172.1 Formyltransferase/hydrolase complex subunit D [Calycomorphotria hydatis]